jgi:glycerophosphoryl diester phosphodiesterase
LQITKDGHVVTNHDPCLKDTTNIESYAWLFGDRKSNYIFPPYENYYSNDYLINDFTLEELKMLRRKTRYNSRNQYFNADFTMLTLEEIIEMLLNWNQNFPRKDIGQKVGLYIETKMYNFYKSSRGYDFADVLFNILKKYDLETVAKSSAKLPIIVECFEIEALERFAQLSDLPLVYLMFYNNPMVSYNMTNATLIAHGVGPKSDWLFKYQNETWNLTSPSKFIDECHSLGLAVHPYSMQDDMLKWTKTPLDELELYITK